MTKRENAIKHCKGFKNAQIEEIDNHIIINYDVTNEKWVQRGATLGFIHFAPRGFKAAHNYVLRSEVQRNECRADVLRSIEYDRKSAAAWAAKLVDAKKFFVPGNVLYSSWGYEQTNIDFYLIIERKNDFVIIQQIGKSGKYTADDQGTCVPDKTTLIGDPFRKKINQFGGISLTSYSSASPYEGGELAWSSYH